jgi:hypothetical protein
VIKLLLQAVISSVGVQCLCVQEIACEHYDIGDGSPTQEMPQPDIHNGYDHVETSRDSSVGVATGYGLDDQERREFKSR